MQGTGLGAEEKIELVSVRSLEPGQSYYDILPWKSGGEMRRECTIIAEHKCQLPSSKHFHEKTYFLQSLVVIIVMDCKAGGRRML